MVDTSPVGLDVAALRDYLTREVPGFHGPVHAELLHGGRSNLTYLLATGNERWVLRRPPLGGLTPSAHDMGREYRFVDALQSTDVPVAKTVVLCEDTSVIGAPFAIVSYVDGVVLRSVDDIDSLAQSKLDTCAASLMVAMARLHAVPYQEVGLTGFGKPAGYLGRQVRRWMDQWQRVATREVADLDKLYDRLAEVVPAESDAAIVHGDYRIDNAILDPANLGTVRAIVDWEMATLGDPLADSR